MRPYRPRSPTPTRCGILLPGGPPWAGEVHAGGGRPAGRGLPRSPRGHVGLTEAPTPGDGPEVLPEGQSPTRRWSPVQGRQWDTMPPGGLCRPQRESTPLSHLPITKLEQQSGAGVLTGPLPASNQQSAGRLPSPAAFASITLAPSISWGCIRRMMNLRFRECERWSKVTELQPGSRFQAKMSGQTCGPAGFSWPLHPRATALTQVPLFLTRTDALFSCPTAGPLTPFPRCGHRTRPNCGADHDSPV